MKKIFYLACLIVLAVVLFAGCDDQKRIANETERIATAAEAEAKAAERTAEATVKMAEAMKEMVPHSITDRESGSTVGWSSLSPSERKEILDDVGVESAHHYGDPIRPTPAIQDVTFILYLVDVPSQSENQTLLEYSYTDARGVTGKNMILVQGHLETTTGDGYIPVESIPYVLNANECCFHYGGCINGTTCSGQRPRAEKFVPCKQTKKEEPCLPCQGQQPGIVIKNDDGETYNSPATSRRLPPRRSRGSKTYTNLRFYSKLEVFSLTFYGKYI